jgi:hypothetical protein
MATSPKRPTQTPTRSHVDYTANHLRKTTSQNIMKGVYINGKIESFGTRLVQWQDTRGPDIQARMNQLGELRLSVQNLQIQGNLNRLLQTIEDGTVYSGMDDSHKDGHGTVAFRIQNDLGDQITGCNITKAHEPATATDISDQEWSIWIADRKITGDTLNTVRQHIQETEMSKWLAAPRKNGREPRLSLTRQQLINTKAITDSWKDILHGQGNC